MRYLNLFFSLLMTDSDLTIMYSPLSLVLTLA